MNILWLRTWILGVKSLALHPLRSLLTVLGIFIGTTSVIWLLSISEGISREAQKQIEDLGANNIIVRSVKPVLDSGASARRLVPYGVTRDDLSRLTTPTLNAIDRALPIREVQKKFFRGAKEMEGRLVGCTPDYAEVMRLKVDRGHFLTDDEIRLEKNHCVLAAEVAELLFPLSDPLDQAVRIEGTFYDVVGVMLPRNPTAGIGGSLAAQEFSSDIYIPISTLWRRIGDRVVTRSSGSFEGEIVELNQVTLRVTEVKQVMLAADLVKETLRPHHENEDVAVIVPLELLEQARTTRLMFMVFMGLIAAISLVVGGIGIMNIMLATVTERTREIGIRRALGAKKRDITRQFLVETIVLTVVGGATGVIGGSMCGLILVGLRDRVLVNIIPEAMEGLPPVIREVVPAQVTWSYPLAFGISVGVGIIFGLYPAIRAAAMDPIEALRHE